MMFKNKKMRKVWSILLTVCLLLGMLPAGTLHVHAADEHTDGPGTRKIRLDLDARVSANYAVGFVDAEGNDVECLSEEAVGNDTYDRIYEVPDTAAYFYTIDDIAWGNPQRSEYTPIPENADTYNYDASGNPRWTCNHYDGYAEGKCVTCAAQCPHGTIADDACTVCGIAMKVTVTVDDTTTYHTDMASALEIWIEGGTMTLLEDVTWGEDINLDDENNLNLNGHTLTLENGSSINIGTWDYYEVPGKVYIYGGGKINGYIFGEAGELRMENTTLTESDAYGYAMYLSEVCSADINGGTVEGSQYGIDNHGSLLLRGGVSVYGHDTAENYRGAAIYNAGTAEFDEVGVISGGSYGEIMCASDENAIVLKKHPAEGTVWRLYRESGGKVVTSPLNLNIANFASTTPGFVVSKAADGSIELISCDHAGGSAVYEYLSEYGHNVEYTCCGRTAYQSHEFDGDQCACGAGYLYFQEEPDGFGSIYSLYLYISSEDGDYESQYVDKWNYSENLWRGVYNTADRRESYFEINGGDTTKVFSVPEGKNAFRPTGYDEDGDVTGVWYSYPCDHDYADAVCTKCGVACEHDWDADNICTVCGTAHEHSFVNGYCGGCGTTCSHSLDADGFCTVCDMRKIYLDIGHWDECSDSDYALTPEAEGVYSLLLPETAENFHFVYMHEFEEYHTYPLSLPERGNNCYYIGESDSYDGDEWYTIIYFSGHWGVYPCPSHTWEDSTCTNCGEVCEDHVFTANSRFTCTVCGFECAHAQWNFYWDRCANCNYSCNLFGGHEFDEMGCCEFCATRQIYVDTRLHYYGAGWMNCYFWQTDGVSVALTEVDGFPGVFYGTIIETDENCSNLGEGDIRWIDNCTGYVNEFPADKNCLRILTTGSFNEATSEYDTEWCVFVPCTHENHTQEGCPDCEKTEGIHSYENGICTGCGLSCPHTGEVECTDLGDGENHSVTCLDCEQAVGAQAHVFDRATYTCACGAETEFPVYVGTIGLLDGEYLISGSNEISLTKPASGGYAYYDRGTLVLHNFTYANENYTTYTLPPVYSTQDLELVLEGTNSLTATSSRYYAYGVYADDLTITGNGSLDVYATDYGITTSGNLTIDGEVELNVFGYFGIYLAEGNMYVANGTLNVTEGSLYITVTGPETGKLTFGDGIIILSPENARIDVRSIGDTQYTSIADEDGNFVEAFRIGPCAHGGETSCQDQEDGTHTVNCVACGMELKTESHSYDSTPGVCGLCGAVCTHDDADKLTCVPNANKKTHKVVCACGVVTAAEQNHTETTYRAHPEDPDRHEIIHVCCGALESGYHNRVYTVNGGTITVSCSDGCGYAGSATISAVSKTYDTLEANVTVSGTGVLADRGFIIDYATQNGTVLYSAPVNAGAYTVSVTFGGKTASVDFTIAKADPTVTAPRGSNGRIYNGKTQSVWSTTGSTTGGTMLYSTDGGVTWQTVVNTYQENAGVYTLWYKVDGGENYNSTAPAHVTAEIAKRDFTNPVHRVSVSLDADSFVYDGTAKEPAVTVLVNGTYTMDAANYTVSYSENVNVGTATVTVTGINNCTGTATKTFAITKAAPAYTVPANLTATYGDTLADVALPAGFAWQDALTTSVGNAGSNTFKATYTPTDLDNYTTVTDIEVAVTVAKANPEYTLPTVGTVYVGQKSGDIVLPAGWSWSDPDHVWSAGERGRFTAEVKFTPADTENYDAVTERITFPVRVRLSEATVTVADQVYTGSALTPEVTVKLDRVDDSFDGYLTEGVDYFVSYSNNVNAGTATVTVTAGADTAEGTVTATFTIAKGQAVIDVKDTPIEVTYGEAVILPEATSNFGTVSCNLTPDNMVNAGTYTVTYSVAETDNYHGTEKTVTVIVKPRILTEDDVVLYSTLTYNGSKQSQRFTVPGGFRYDVSGNTATDAGDYTLTVTAFGNYTGSVSKAWSIGRKNISGATVTLGDALTYNGTEQTQTVSGVAIDGMAVTFDVTGNKQKDAGSYTLTVTGNGNFAGEVTAVWSMAKAQLTVTAADHTVTYGDAPANAGALFEGFVNGETAAVLGGETAYSYTYAQFGNVGTYRITPSGLTSGNYSITFVDGTLTVNPRNLEIQADAAEKIYGETDPVLRYQSSGLVNGDEITGALRRAEGEDVGTYAVNLGTLTAGGNYTIAYTGANFKITPKAITLADVALDGALVYTGAEQTQPIAVTEGITYEVSGNKAVDVGTYELTVKGTGNYTGQIRLAWSIKAAMATATAPAANTLTYTGEAQALVTAGTAIGGKLVYSLAENGEYTETVPTGMNAGTYTVWYYVQGDANHADSEKQSVAVRIEKARVEITVDTTPITVTYGETVMLPAASTNFGTVTCDKTAADLKNAGTYTVKYTVEGTDNYEGASKSLTVRINPKNVEEPSVSGAYIYTGSEQTVALDGFDGGYMTVVSGNKGTGAGSYQVLLTLDSNHVWADGSDGKVQWNIGKAKTSISVNTDGITVTYGETVTLPEATSNFGTVTCDKTAADLVNAGTYTVTYTVADTANFDGDAVEVTVLVNPKPVTELDFGVINENLIYTGEPQTVELKMPEGASYDVVEGSLTATNVGMYGFTIAFRGNYSGIFTQGFQILKAAPAYTEPTANALTYNGKVQPLVTAGTSADGTLVYSLSEDGEFTETIPTGKDAGTYTVWFYLRGDSNHKSSAKASVDVHIGKAELTVTAKNNSVVYGDAPANAGAAYAGFVNNETADVLSGTLNYAYSYAQFGDVGTYKITPSGLTSGNYEISFADGTLTVTPKTVTVKADAKTKCYGEADPALTFEVEGLVNGDQLTGELKRAVGENVGTYAIEQNTLTAGGNYTVTYTGANLTVSKRPVTVTAKDQTVVYGSAISDTEMTVSGLVEGHRAAAILTPSTDQVTVSGTVTPSAAIITADGADVTANYEIRYEDGKLVIEPETSAVDDLTADTVTSADREDIEELKEILENADSLREAWEALEEKCDALLEKLEDVARENQQLKETADSYGEDTVKSSDRAALEQLIEDAQTQIDSGNVTEAEKEELEQIQETAEKLIDVIDETAAQRKELTEKADSFEEETVTSGDQKALEQLVKEIDVLLNSGNLTEAERKTLADAKAEAEELLEVIEKAKDAVETDQTEKAQDVTAENVKPADQDVLTDAKADLEQALEENGGNYTAAEKQAIREEIQRIEDALQVLEKVENVTDTVEQLPETVEPDDETAAEEIMAAQAAFEALSDYEKSLLDDAVKAKLEELVSALGAYDIVKGDGETWNPDDGEDLQFTANGPIRKFTGIKVDDEAVDEKYYEAEAGSTVITLKDAFLKALAPGEHTLTVVYTDGETSGSFHVQPGAEVPAAVEDSNNYLWIIIVVACIAVPVILVIVSRKRKSSR